MWDYRGPMAGSKNTGTKGEILGAGTGVPNPGDAGREAGYGRAFAMELAHGHCVGVDIPDLRAAQIMTQGRDAPPARSPLDVEWPIPVRGLSPDERAHAKGLRGYRRPDYIAGRLALRAALAELGIAADTIGATRRGAPDVPAGAVGSISHKRPFAIALAAHANGWTLGVDLERQQPTKTDISRRVLTDAELAELAALGFGDFGDRAFQLEVVRRFSIKEAIYKAIDPFVERYVGFREVTLHPPSDHASWLGASDAPGSAEVAVHTHLDPPPPRPLEVKARVVEFRDHFISSARARLL